MLITYRSIYATTALVLSIIMIIIKLFYELQAIHSLRHHTTVQPKNGIVRTAYLTLKRINGEHHTIGIQFTYDIKQLNGIIAVWTRFRAITIHRRWQQC